MVFISFFTKCFEFRLEDKINEIDEVRLRLTAQSNQPSGGSRSAGSGGPGALVDDTNYDEDEDDDFEDESDDEDVAPQPKKKLRSRK